MSVVCVHVFMRIPKPAQFVQIYCSNRFIILKVLVKAPVYQRYFFPSDDLQGMVGELDLKAQARAVYWRTDLPPRGQGRTAIFSLHHISRRRASCRLKV